MKRVLIWISASSVGFAFAGEPASPLGAGWGGAGRWERSFTGSLTTQEGNTNLTSYALALSSEYVGNLEWGRISLKESEVKFAISHSRGRLDKALYEHDGSASLLLDIMAHQTFSPFFLSFWSYDSTTALKKRVQLGAGGKYTIGAGFSVSLAYLWEAEKYKGNPGARQYRLSLRPKYKKTFANGIAVNYMIFIQPLVRDFYDYLIDNHFTLTVPTLLEKLKITVTWRDQYNSGPPKDVENRDTDVKVGMTLLF